MNVSADVDPSQRVMFLYWGRRGAMSRFTLDLGRAALAMPDVAASISVSRQNENYEQFRQFGPALFAIDTFTHHAGVVTNAWRIPVLRRQLHHRLARDRTTIVIDLMPHIWSSLVVPAIHAAGSRYVAVTHDATSHPGDPTRRVKRLVDRSMRQADCVLTLSRAVADTLRATGKVPAAKIVPLFHPELDYGGREPRAAPRPGEPWRILFLGRILRYKGLPQFTAAIDILRQAGIALDMSVLGEGDLGAERPRLEAMGARIVNRWLDDGEIAAALAHCHVVVLSHTEASQSGIVAAALGAGAPVVATPVGGLREQVEDGVTGVLTDSVDAAAIAAGIRRLLSDADLYQSVCANIARTHQNRSMAEFIRASIAAAGPARR